MNKETWIRKLTSRKFWLALAGLITGIITFVKEPTTDAQTISSLILALGSVVAYCIGEGLADAANVEPHTVFMQYPQMSEDEPPDCQETD